MIAKQTAVSASLLVLVGGPAVTAYADPDQPAGDAVGEVQAASDLVDCAGAAPGCALPDDPPPPPRTPTGRFQVGAGYSTDEGFLATATVAQDNLFGTGNHLSLTAMMSSRRQLFLTRFVDPGLFGSRLGLAVDVYNQRQDLVGLEREASGGTMTLFHPLGQHVRAYVGYRAEHVTAERDRAALARGEGLAYVPLAPGTLSALRAGITYDSRDAAVLPTRGTSAGFAVEVADHRIGSDVDLTRIESWLQHHRSIGPFIVHLGGSVSTVTSSDPYGVPVTERLHFDGSNDVRGYSPGALGPTDRISGMPLGGNLKALARGELELPLGGGFSLAGFADAGTVYDRDGRGGVGYSAGLGVIWRSPIGPIRFDIATPFTGDNRGEPRFLFSIGGTF